MGPFREDKAPINCFSRGEKCSRWSLGPSHNIPQHSLPLYDSVATTTPRSKIICGRLSGKRGMGVSQGVIWCSGNLWGLAYDHYPPAQHQIERHSFLSSFSFFITVVCRNEAAFPLRNSNLQELPLSLYSFCGPFRLTSDILIHVVKNFDEMLRNVYSGNTFW